jgi:hypothetical protein
MAGQSETNASGLFSVAGVWAVAGFGVTWCYMVRPVLRVVDTTTQMFAKPVFGREFPGV